MDPSQILVIEDDEIVAQSIERSLRGDEFRVMITNSGMDGLRSARRLRPALVILDIIMPGMDGYAVCKEIRSDPNLQDVPILFLTAKIRDEDKIAGFLAGGDDYLTKPFNLDELILRIRAILRRSRPKTASQTEDPAYSPRSNGRDMTRNIEENIIGRPASQRRENSNEIVSSNRANPLVEKNRGERHQIIVGEYTLDTRSFELYTPHRGRVRLTPVQYDLLHHLMRHPNEIFSPVRLLDEVWNYPTDTGSPDLVRVHIKNLRDRIEANPHSPVFIRTIPGYGYTVGLAYES
jgi:DNA-binding response OmpR family regulator